MECVVTKKWDKVTTYLSGSRSPIIPIPKQEVELLEQNLNLKVIKTTPLHQLYLNAYYRTAENSIEDDDEAYQRLIFYGVNYVVSYKYPTKDCKESMDVAFLLHFINVVKVLMTKLTPSEIIRVFPIKKDYNGEKYGVKDYFYTINMLEKYNLDEPIGDNIDDFLWYYHNDTLREFLVVMLSTVSDLRKLEGKLSIGEEWAINNNTSILKSGYVYDHQNQKTFSYKKSKPKHLKIID